VNAVEEEAEEERERVQQRDPTMGLMWMLTLMAMSPSGLERLDSLD
jgi:thiamine kinase-like enzyme